MHSFGPYKPKHHVYLTYISSWWGSYYLSLLILDTVSYLYPLAISQNGKKWNLMLDHKVEAFVFF